MIDIMPDDKEIFKALNVLNSISDKLRYEKICEISEAQKNTYKKLLEKFKEEAKIEAYRYSSYLFVYDLLELDRDKRKTENKFFEEEISLLVDKDGREIAIYKDIGNGKVKPYKMIEV